MQILRFLFGVGRPFLRHEVAYGLADGHGFGFVQKLVLNVAVFQKRGNGGQYRQVVLLIIGRNQDAEKSRARRLSGVSNTTGVLVLRMATTILSSP